MRARKKSRRGGRADAEEVGDRRVTALGGKGQSGLAVVGFDVSIGTMGEQQFEDLEMAIRSGAEKRRVAGAVAVIGIECAFQEPADHFGATGGNGGRERVVTAAIRSGGVDVGAFFGEVTRRLEVTEETGKSEDREAVRGKGFREQGIRVDEVFDASEIAGRRGFGKLHGGPRGEKHCTDFGASGVDGHEEGRNARFVARRSEGRIGGEERADLGEVAGADGLKEGFRVAHSGKRVAQKPWRVVRNSGAGLVPRKARRSTLRKLRAGSPCCRKACRSAATVSGGRGLCGRLRRPGRRVRNASG